LTGINHASHRTGSLMTPRFLLGCGLFA